ncbi:MAG TPA: hypothetical protein VFJ16_03905 [Longimicrobium sp.]|nr:hypothetical protein [Longimicrobium sp.]
MRKLVFFVVGCLCLAADASAATAQRDLVFSGIPWRVTADSARTLLQRRGFTFVRQDKDGDHEYSHGDGTLLTAWLQNGRLAGIMVIDPARVPQVSPRYQALADSLEAAQGKPDTSVAMSWARWEWGLTEMMIANSTAGSARHVELTWEGPGLSDEMERRAEAEHPGRVILSPRPAGYTIVSSSGLSQTVVDTLTLSRRAGGVLHGRVRIEYVRSVGPDSAMFDSAEYEMDFDCAGGRTRLAARTTRLAGRVQRADTFNALPWETPRADGHYARGLRAVCRVAAARPQIGAARASPARVRH